MKHGADEERILAWLTSKASDSDPDVSPPPSAPSVAEAAASRAERDQRLKAQTQQLRASALTREIRVRAPRFSAAKAAEHGAAWSRILTDPERLDDWLNTGLRVNEHAIAARCVAARITPARLRSLLRDPELAARLRAGADPRDLLPAD